MSEDVGVNPYANCPKCKSNSIDQMDIDEVEWYHCVECGCWYNAEGEVDE